MKKQFKDVAEGEVFTFSSIEYKKIPLVKISCCKSINCEQTQNTSAKTFFQPTTEVEVNDQL